MQKHKRHIFHCITIFSLLILLSISGCRQRIIDVITEPEVEYTPPENVTPPPQIPDPPPEPQQPESPTENTVEPDPEPQEPDQPELPEQEDPPPPPEPPESESIPEVPITPIIEPLAHDPIQTPVYDTPTGTAPEGYQVPPILVEEVEGTPYVTIEDPSPEAAGDTTLDADGEGTLGLLLDHHVGILNRGLGSLFECQRLYVYFEHLADFHTVNRSSAEHSLIIDSGGFNAAARRGNDSLVVDEAWVQRQNPAVIIRTVSSGILGSNVIDISHAAVLRNEVLERPGFENVNAIIHRRVLLLSNELLQSYEGRLIAKLHIAHTMYPTLFGDVNLTELYTEIAAAGGRDYTRGIFAFPN